MTTMGLWGPRTVSANTVQDLLIEEMAHRVLRVGWYEGFYPRLSCPVFSADYSGITRWPKYYVACPPHDARGLSHDRCLA